MRRDRFDRILLLALVGVVAALAWMLLAGRGEGDVFATTVDRDLEQAMAVRTRMAFLEQTYAPVAELQRQGRDQQALLKLAELDRRFPGEAHGELLRAASLQRLGALDEAITAAVRGIRRNGDYLEDGSPWSRRGQIESLVAAGLKNIVPRARAHPGDPVMARAVKNVHYLQSRLAGGCE